MANWRIASNIYIYAFFVIHQSISFAWPFYVLRTPWEQWCSNWEAGGLHPPPFSKFSSSPPHYSGQHASTPPLHPPSRSGESPPNVSLSPSIREILTTSTPGNAYPGGERKKGRDEIHNFKKRKCSVQAQDMVDSMKILPQTLYPTYVFTPFAMHHSVILCQIHTWSLLASSTSYAVCHCVTAFKSDSDCAYSFYESGGLT
jgi:hypothetical protein